jgi:hypothetical protein
VKKHLTLILAGLTAVSLAAGCKKEEAPKTVAQPQPAVEQSAQPTAGGKSGKVIETMNSGGYTYVLVDTGSEKVWAAAPEFQVKVGDPVAIPEGMPMTNYHSKTLNRDFEMVYFVDGIMVGGQVAAPSAAPTAAPGEAKMPEGHPPLTVQSAQKNGVDVSGIKKVEGGQTVADVFAGKANLAGKDVKVRGKVVKFSPGIMGKNWIHLQDGTGKEGANDLTITTSETVKVGDTVVVAGKVSTDKDFGYGYKYDVILEDAKLTVE